MTGATRGSRATRGRFLSSPAHGAALDVLVVMDDPAAIDPAVDTTMALIDELRLRGHRVRLSLCSGLWLAGDGVRADLVDGDPLLVATCDVVLIRADPPFDVDYLHATLLLEHVRDDCLLLNDPRALRDCNEKLYALRFPDLVPPTVVSADRRHLIDFLDEQGGRGIVKPLDGCGGRGVFVADLADPNLPVILEAATGDGRRRVVAQRYLEAATRVGDKRVVLLDGEPIGALLRTPAAGQSRANIHAGGSACLAALDSRDRQIVDEVGKHCRAQGLILVGLDIIGGYLTEINVTSPAGMRTMGRLSGCRPEVQVIDWLEARCGLRPGTAPVLAAA